VSYCNNTVDKVKVRVSEIFIAVTCLMHASQLITKSSLDTTDDHLLPMGSLFRDTFTSYYSAFAKIVHTWRDNLRMIFFVWRRTCDSEFALKHGQHKIPTLVQGRWGSLFSCQDKMADCGESNVRTAFNVIFEGSKHKTSAVDAAASIDAHFALSRYR
jgi:hypothetical protein